MQIDAYNTDKKSPPPNDIYLSEIMRKILSILLIVLFSYDWFYRLLGLLNRRFHCFKSVFVLYLPSSRELNKYSNASIRRWMRWRPLMAGFGRQIGGGWMVIMAIPNNEDEFMGADSQQHLAQLYANVCRIQRLLQVPQHGFAGVLPGVMAAKGIRDASPEAEVTINVVGQAEQQIRQLAQLSDDVPLIVLGGAGFIGRRLVAQYRAAGRQVFVVDPQGTADDVWPVQLTGQPAVLLNLTRKYAVEQYVHMMWQGMVFLNEVYPAPAKPVLQRIAQQGVDCFHVVGVRGRAYPNFPDAYAGAIPCCAAQPDGSPQAVVRLLLSAHRQNDKRPSTPMTMPMEPQQTLMRRSAPDNVVRSIFAGLLNRQR